MCVTLGLAHLLAAAPPPASFAAIAYDRFPAIHGDTIVFGTEGDLWRVTGSGRGAARLTRHPAEEAYPALSPDGTTLAFSAAYDEQLAAAIRHLEDRIREEPMNDLPPPAFPRRAVE